MLALLLQLLLAALLTVGATAVLEGLRALVSVDVPPVVVPVVAVVLLWLVGGLTLALVPLLGAVLGLLAWLYWLRQRPVVAR